MSAPIHPGTLTAGGGGLAVSLAAVHLLGVTGVVSAIGPAAVSGLCVVAASVLNRKKSRDIDDIRDRLGRIEDHIFSEHDAP